MLLLAHLLFCNFCCALAPPPQSPANNSGASTRRQTGASGRRAFVTSALTAGALGATAPAARAWPFAAPAGVPTTYDDFLRLLANDQLSSVEFGSDGLSLVCLDAQGVSRPVKDLPDDKGLLAELITRRVDVTLQEYKFTKQMNSANWVKNLMGGDLTDEELYAYKGYKTYRSSPGQGNIPSSLISGLKIPPTV